MHIKNDKFKIQIQSGENSEIRDIDKSSLSKRLDINNKKWSFNISNSDFIDIKKLSSINSEGKVIHINLHSNKVFLSEPAVWELEIDSVKYENKHLIFNKTFLSSINDDSNIEFNIFDNFILLQNDNSNFMMSFEQDFTE